MCVMLASDIPAAREVIVDGQTAVLFRTGDVEDLASKTVALARDQWQRTRIGSKACRAVRGRGLARLGTRYEQLFRDVLLQPTRPD